MKSIKQKRRHVNQNKTQGFQGIQWTKDYHWGSETLGMCMNILKTLLSYTSVWTMCIFLQLILSGDVESNPGPVG